MSEKEKVLNEIYGLLLPYRKSAKQVNFNPDLNKTQAELKEEYLKSEILEIICSNYIIKVQVL